MATEQSINKIISYGKSVEFTLREKAEGKRKFNLITYKPIGQLGSSCCTFANTEVIDFDLFQIGFTKIKELQHFKSCDALKIVGKQLDFIEMKGFGKNLFLNPKRPTEKKSKSEVEKEIDSFGINEKIKDSLLLWDLFIKEKDILEGKEVREMEKEVVFQFILLTDVEVESLEWITLNFNYFADYNSNLDSFLIQKLELQLNDIDLSILARIKGVPLLKTCSEIDDYYTNV